MPAAPSVPPAPRRSWWATLNPVPKAFLIIFGVAVGLCVAPAGIFAVATSGNRPAETATLPASQSPERRETATTPTSAAGAAAPATMSAAPPSTTTVRPAPPNPAPTTKPASQCDPNYSGACVPIASDVDCAGGDGNGPAYVQGPVYVIGTDIYDLDRDGNGIGCEN